MKILVTGAAGFIGSHLVDYLADKGYLVFGIDDLSGGFKRNISLKSQFTCIDLKNKENVNTYIQKIKPEIIYHLAADATEGRSQFTPISAIENNILAYTYVLTSAIKHNLKKVVLVSSMSVYGNQIPPFSEDIPRKPDDIYGVAKASMEQMTEILASVYKFGYVIIRPHNVYGPRQNISDPYRNVIGIFINCLLHGKPYYIYGNGLQKRAFTYIDDLVIPLATVGLLESVNGEIFNIGPEKEYTINELSQTLLRIWFSGRQLPKEMVPFHAPFRPKEILNAYCTVDKAKKILGYKTHTSLAIGLKNMIRWARNLGPVPFRYTDLDIITEHTPDVWKNRKI